MSDSFFNLFTYDHMMHNSIDCGFVYTYCEITRDVSTLGLTKGDMYMAVWFLFDKGEFEFITEWVSSDPSNPDHYDKIPGEGSITIAQADLAPYLMWNEKDLPAIKV